MPRYALPVLLWLALLALATGVNAQEPDAPAPPKLDIYSAPDGAATVEHRLIKGNYTVQFSATGVVRHGPEKRRLHVPPPEPGEMSRGPILTGGLVKATSKLVKGTLVITLTRARYKLPSADAFAQTNPNSRALGPLIDDLGKAWIGGKRSIKSKLHSLLRKRRSKQVRSMLVLIALLYGGALEKCAEEQQRPTREALGTALGLKLASDAVKQVSALQFAVHGYRVGGRFKPEAAPATPTRCSIKGEVGRAVLLGSIDEGDPSDDWWELAMPKDAKVYPVDLPKSARFFIVRDPSNKDVIHLRLRATGDAGAYKIEVRNKRGQEHKWIELHERPANDQGPAPY